MILVKLNIKQCLFLCFILTSGCYFTMVTDSNTQVKLRSMKNLNDSFSKANMRYVFTNISCETIKLKDSKGNPTFINSQNTDTTKSYFTCFEYTNSYDVIMINTPVYNNISITIEIYMDGKVILNNGKCIKNSFNVIHKLKDSLPIVIWYEINRTIGTFNVYSAIESYNWPYYKENTLDSFVFKYSELCTEKELNDQKSSIQDIINKNVQVNILPNPFKESFNLTFDPGYLKGSYYIPYNLTLTFYNDKGIVLHSQIIEQNKQYNFSVPSINSGQVLFYRITWDEYFIM